MRKEIDEQDTKLQDSIEGLQSMPDIKGKLNCSLSSFLGGLEDSRYPMNIYRT